MIEDARGLPHSASDAALVARLDRFALEFLAARAGAADALALAEERPDCGLAQVYAAMLHVYVQSTAHLAAQARPLLVRAAALRPAMHEREARLGDAVAAACAGDHARALEHCERIAARWPRDVVAAKFAEFMFYLAPDYARHRRFMDAIAAANAGFSHAEAMHAFALELDGDYARAERVAETAIAHDEDTPWAHHALAHLYLNCGRLDDGLRLLRRLAPTWDGHARPMQCHNWWHVALLDLAGLDSSAAMAIYRDRVWGGEANDPQEHVDAISLLWRLELAGDDVGGEWRAVAAAIAPRADEQVFPFLSAHYGYALTRAGEHAAAGAALAALSAHAARAHGPAARTWRRVGVPLVQGCVAAAAGDHTRAAALLEPILAEMPCAGGSDAQNDLFRQTCLVAWLATGRHALARDFLARRLRGRQPLPLEQRWLSRAGG